MGTQHWLALGHWTIQPEEWPNQHLPRQHTWWSGGKEYIANASIVKHSMLRSHARKWYSFYAGADLKWATLVKYSLTACTSNQKTLRQGADSLCLLDSALTQGVVKDMYPAGSGCILYDLLNFRITY